jgi:hypothetical protein
VEAKPAAHKPVAPKPVERKVQAAEDVIASYVASKKPAHKPAAKKADKPAEVRKRQIVNRQRQAGGKESRREENR